MQIPETRPSLSRLGDWDAAEGVEGDIDVDIQFKLDVDIDVASRTFYRIPIIYV